MIMNLDAAFVFKYLEKEKVGRQPATIARKLSLSRQRVNGALVLLEAIGWVEKLPHGTVQVKQK